MKAKPVPERVAQADDCGHGSVGNGLLWLESISPGIGFKPCLDSFAGLVDLAGHPGEQGRGLRRIDSLHPAPRVFEIGDGLSEGRQRGDLGESFRLDLQLAQLVVQVVLEQQIVDPPILTHGIEIELCQRCEPVAVELFQPSVAGW